MNNNTAIRGLQIRDAFFGTGLKRNGSNGDIAQVDFVANDGLKLSTNSLTIAYDDTTIGIISNNLAIKNSGVNTTQLADDAVTPAKIDLNTEPGAGQDGYVVYWNNAAGKLDFKAETIADQVELEDFAVEDLSADADGIKVDYDLAVTIGAQLQVFLNGLLQQVGSGKDYTTSISAGKTRVTFTVAPETGDIVIFSYVKSS